LADSPWNVRRAIQQRPAEKLVNPENPLALPPQAGTPGENAQGRSPQAVRRRTSGLRTALARGRLSSLLLIALALLVLAGALSYARESGRLGALTAQREAEARRLQAWRDEHLNARRNSGYLETIRKYAKEYGIDPSFVSAVIKCESSFNPLAVSRVSARGLMQIMPDTGVWLAGKLGIEGYTPELLFEPETSIRMGAYYLAHLSNLFSGSPAMVAAAYHAGDGNVKAWALRHGEDMKTITVDQIPAEDTRSYVRKVLDAYAIYHEEDLGATLGSLPGIAATDARTGARTGK